MDQLFYNIDGGIVHQIRRKERTTISEVIVRDKRNIKQNRVNFSVKSSSFIFDNFKTEKFKLSLLLKVETDQFVIRLVLPVSFCQNLLHFTLGQANRDGADAKSPFPLFFSLFLHHLRTLAQEKRSENCLHFGTGGPSLCLYL